MRGHVPQRGTTWCYVVDVPAGLDGKRKQQWRGGVASRREADQALVEVLHSVDRGTYVPRDRVSLGPYLSDWLEGLQLAPASVYSYRKSLLGRSSRRSVTSSCKQVDPTTLRRFSALLMAENATMRSRSGTSVQLIHQILHRALGDAA